MNKTRIKGIFLSGLVALAVLTIGVPKHSFATVGGPLLLSEFKYDTSENKVYYLRSDTSGAGFGPSLIEYDPASQEFSTVGTDEYLLERLDEQQKKLIRFTDPEEIREFLTSLDPLPRIDLAKNDIEFEVSLAEDYDAEYTIFYPEHLQVELTVRVLQDGKEIDSSSFYDCGDRIAFEGFLMPGTSQLLLFVNNIGRCIEDGYTVDRVVPIAGFTIKDPTTLASSSIPAWEERQWPAGMIPAREGTVVVTVDVTTEEKYTRLQSFAGDAYSKGEYEAAVDYLASVWFHCCFYQKSKEGQETYYPVAFELAAIQSERGEIRGYKSTFSILENLFERLNVQERASYRQKILADARFAQLRGELSQEEFDVLMSGLGVEEPPPEAPAQEGGPVNRDGELETSFLPLPYISAILGLLLVVGLLAIVYLIRKKRDDPPPNSANST